MSQTSSHSNNDSSSEILDNSDLEDYDSSSSDSPSLAQKLDLSAVETDDLKYDEDSEKNLQCSSKKHGFTIEYIPLPSKSLRGLYQVFVKLTFTANKGKQNHPIVTHGTGETLKIARARAAERALKHLDLMLSVP